MADWDNTAPVAIALGAAPDNTAPVAIAIGAAPDNAPPVPVGTDFNADFGADFKRPDPV